MKYTVSSKPLALDSKRSYQAFLKHTWTMSNTNLHFIDWKEKHAEALKEIYKPHAVL